MAKSIHMNEMETEFGNSKASRPSGSFWEHWFDTQSPRRFADRSLDEHSIWEKAVSFAVLAAEKSKC